MTTNSSGGSKTFHTYENVCYDEQHITGHQNYTISAPSSLSQSTSASSSASSNGANNSNGSVLTATATVSTNNGSSGAMSIAVNKAAIESPFVDPMLHDSSNITPNQANITTTSAAAAAALTTTTTKIQSTTDSSGTTRMLTSSRVPPGQSLVTKLITFPPQSPMDSLKEWSVSTFKCTKQLINEKRGICPVTNDSQLQNDIEQLRENRNKLVQMLRLGQQMTSHYAQLVRTQRQLHSLMNEMSIKSFNSNNSILQTSISNHHSISNKSSHQGSNNYTNQRQVVANFSSLGNNLSSSTTTTSPTHPHSSSKPASSHLTSSAFDSNLEDFLPVLNYMKSSNLNLADDFKKNALTLSVAIKNGEKLLAALNFYCSNLATLIDKTIEDTLTTVKQYESARLEYDAEKNSLNFISPTAQTSITYSSDKLELARMRYEQLREDVQIKMRFLEENTIKVMHKQLLMFNGAFASYTSGNTAALDATLKQFSIRDTTS